MKQALPNTAIMPIGIYKYEVTAAVNINAASVDVVIFRMPKHSNDFVLLLSMFSLDDLV